MFLSLTCANTFIQEIIQIFYMVLLYFIGGFGYDYFAKHLILGMVGEEEYIQEEKVQKKIKVGLLTNEIPPVVYGGVATWIVNFLKMFEDDENIEVIPIFSPTMINSLQRHFFNILIFVLLKKKMISVSVLRISMSVSIIFGLPLKQL